MRIVFTGGGTGGHVYPGVEILKTLKEQSDSSLEYCWLGRLSGPEYAIALQEKIPFHAIHSGKLRRYFSLHNVSDIFNTAAGIWDSFWFLRTYKPQVLFSKGGFVSVPPVIAAHLLHIPVITHESDLDPGLANRIISRYAQGICVAYQESAEQYIRGAKVYVTGNPVRREVLDGNAAEARRRYGIPDHLPVVLVLGGSQGALEINNVIWQWAKEGIEGLYIVHQAGEKTFKPIEAKNYRIVKFIGSELKDLLAAADIVISRAGAGAIGEIAATGTPMILIPKGLNSTRGDQIRNADLFEKHHAAIVLKDADVTLENLKNTVVLLDGDAAARRQMADAAKNLIQMGASDAIASVLEPYLHGERRESIWP